MSEKKEMNYYKWLEKQGHAFEYGKSTGELAEAYAKYYHSAMTEAPKDVNGAIEKEYPYRDKEVVDRSFANSMIDNLRQAAHFGYSLAGNDKWISVDDRLPVCFHSGILDGLKSDEVIVECENGSKHIAVLYSGILDVGQFNDWYDNSDFELHHVVKWTNIPL